MEDGKPNSHEVVLRQKSREAVKAHSYEVANGSFAVEISTGQYCVTTVLLLFYFCATYI